MTDPTTVDFALVDRSGRLAAVRLVQEIGLPGPLDFVRTEGTWRLSVTVPDVARMEYLFDIEDHNGNRATITDPDNPCRVGGAFGDKSVRIFPGYRAPHWLTIAPVPADVREHRFTVPGLDDSFDLTLWTPAGLTDSAVAPLLVV